jgi:multisubunit Na+/H+ antiporter MnhB subunit
MLAISVLLIIAMWRIFVKRKYPGWLILIPIGLVLIPVIGWVLIPVAHAIIQGIVAWKDR